MAIIDDIKRQYRQGGMLLRIIYINIGVFLLLNALNLVAWLTGLPVNAPLWVEVPSNAHELLMRPWTLLTYCFSHVGLLHILFNLLWLYWMGHIFLEYFAPKHLSGLYVLGGIGGALLYVLAYNVLPPFAGSHAYLIGASASVIAIVVAVAVFAPDYPIGLLFLGRVALKWVALGMVLLSVLGMSAGDNAGGNLAHLGGALVGLWFATAYRRGRDITAWLNAALDSVAGLFRRRSRGVGQPVGGTAWRGQASRGGSSSRSTGAAPTEADLDRVLDKIRRSGYASLTDAERDLLFRASRRR